MSRVVYSLLVGINDYPAPVSPLRGCVNDVNRVEALLGARVAGHDNRLEVMRLTDGEATREAIIAGFRSHLSKAGPDDVVLFYYSGHGSQSPSPPEFWHLEPDHLDETLVCWDSRLPGGWDLADKELAQLISEVAEKGPHILVVLDCCHSGSGTRAPDEEEIRVRRVPTDDRPRPIETFLVSPAQAEAFSQTGRIIKGGGWYTLPKGRHIVLAACSPEEQAKELNLGGEQRGAFSYYLVDTLQRARQSPNYRDLFKRANALVRARVSAQSPQAEATDVSDLDQPFLGGIIAARSPYLTLSHDRQRGWIIDAGSVHGMAGPEGDETTLLALFPFDAQADDLYRLANTVGEARVEQVFPAQISVRVTMPGGAVPDPDTTYKAVITALPLPPQVVAFSGDEAGLALVRRALAEAGPDAGPSLLIREGPRDEAELSLSAEENRYRIRRAGDAYALVVDTPGFNNGSARLVVQRIEHIARWRKIMELANASSLLDAGAVRLEVLRPDRSGAWQPVAMESNIRLEYDLKNGKWEEPQFKVRLTNTSKRRLYCMLLDLPESYGVFPELMPGGGIWLDPEQAAWANDGEPIYARVLDELWEQGVVEFKDTLKLIVSTDECDATLLRQDDLPVTVLRSTGEGTRGLTYTNTLDRLMNRVQMRHFSSRPARAESFVDWATAEISFTTVRPLEAAEVARPGERTELGYGVSVRGHASLNARARLTTLLETGRDAGNLTLPAALRDNPFAAQPFEFSASRNGEPGLSVLELIDVTDHSVVTADDPLVVEIAAPISDDEHLLPVGFDGEFFLPLGRVVRTAEGVEVKLERLPAPTSSGMRDLKGSIRIMFQKIISEKLGFSFPYPLLAAATVDEKGEAAYTHDREAIKASVGAAGSILLYIHGILGDTRGMAGSARTGWMGLPAPIPSLADSYDLILTFDYENINTSIENNARLLKQRLADVGLGPGHGKTLHVVAHSMGGLVSRWFIEREGGNQVAQHLVMMGTPNAGSPWPRVQDWATAALGIGLNALAGVVWPVKALAALVSALETVDVSLDQMKPGSDLLQSLASSPDPGIPYTIIAGNTSIIAAALEEDKAGGVFGRLWARIKPGNWLHAVTAPVFFGHPNDIAVSIESIQSVPGNRSPQPKMVAPVACDHITYFCTEAGLRVLVESLRVD
jgi:pimeloyl-ACP methyl ester carboxylesterase